MCGGGGGGGGGACGSKAPELVLEGTMIKLCLQMETSEVNERCF